MDELSDFELQRNEEEAGLAAAASGQRRARPAFIIAAVIVAAGVPAYIWFPRAQEPPPSTAPTIAYRPVPAPARATQVIDVPPLDQSDDTVRRLLGALSAHPRVTAWLATPNLIRTFALAVENIADGATPARHLRVLRPTAPFRVIEDGEVQRIDPRSYERYDGIADAVVSIDTGGAATLYATLEPRLDEAYRELGHADGFDTALMRAIDVLVRTPVTAADVPVAERGALTVFADPRLQELTAAQKQLLRMGPRNARMIQGKLREIAAAIERPAAAGGR
jgi:hypothetical protein